MGDGSTMTTPLERLDDAVQAFLADIEDEGRFVTGWALGISTARIQSEDEEMLPMVTGAQYALGPQTSIIQFAGLAKYLEVVSEKVTWGQLSDADDDD